MFASLYENAVVQIMKSGFSLHIFMSFIASGRALAMSSQVVSFRTGFETPGFVVQRVSHEPNAMAENDRAGLPIAIVFKGTVTALSGPFKCTFSLCLRISAARYGV